MKQTVIKNTIDVLVIDDENSNINYSKSSIKTLSEQKLDLDGIFELFQLEPDEIWHHNTSKAITLILDDNSEISLHEYNKNVNPVFLKITNTILQEGNNDIIIILNDNFKISPYYSNWQSEDLQIFDDIYIIMEINKNSTNGYNNCQKIINNISDIDCQIPAIEYCNNQKITINGNQYNGYLPLIQQLEELFKYINLVNHITMAICNSTLNLENYKYLSSTELNYKYVYNLDCGKARSIAKDNSGCKVLPFFKQIN